jgi:hypothetical protein
MWEPRRLTTLWASMACYRDSFTYYLMNRFMFAINEHNNVHRNIDTDRSGQVLMLVFRNRDELNSFLSLDPDRDVSCFISVLLDMYWDNSSDYVKTISVRILSSSVFTRHPAIRSRRFWNIDSDVTWTINTQRYGIETDINWKVRYEVLMVLRSTGMWHRVIRT